MLYRAYFLVNSKSKTFGSNTVFPVNVYKSVSFSGILWDLMYINIDLKLTFSLLTPFKSMYFNNQNNFSISL